MVKVVFTMKPHRSALQKLHELGFDVTFFPGRNPSREWLESELRNAECVVVPPFQVVDKEFLDLAPSLRLLVIHGSGTDSVVLEEVYKRRICVANAPDFIAEAVAEHVLALTLSILRRVVEGDRAIRTGEWREGAAPRRFLGNSIKGKVVGIIGLGRVGTEVAKLFRLLGAHVVYWSRRRKPEVEHALGIKFARLEDLLKSSDIAVLSIALTEETEGMIGDRELSLMKDGAILINVSRGAIIDEVALLNHLRSGRISAGLDVFWREPLKDSEILRYSNVVLTPHIAGYTYEAMVGTALEVTEIIREFFLEKTVPATALNLDYCSISRK